MLDEHMADHATDSDKTRTRGPRPRGSVRPAMVQAGLELARAGGPDAVVLREVTRLVGVVPNAAYRHFSDREALLAAIRDEALSMLALRMADGMNHVSAGPQTEQGAGLRLRAVGKAYLAFAREEPGLFDTAFTSAHPHPSTDRPSDRQTPFDHLQAALDNLVEAGVLAPERKPVIEYPIWATVHGMATLLRGPLEPLTDREKRKLEAQALDFIGSAVGPEAEPAGARVG
jgi:AcrR family transcriptional regulator